MCCRKQNKNSKLKPQLELFYPNASMGNNYIEDITRWREHMKFIFEWKKYFTSERSKRVKSFFHEKINFICSSQRVIFFILHRYECFENKKKLIRLTFVIELIRKTNADGFRCFDDILSSLSRK